MFVFGNKFNTPDILKELQHSVESGWIGCGPKVKFFESLFSERYGKSFVMTNNGSNALFLAIELLDLPPGSKIALPSFTFEACLNAIASRYEPIFCDVELDGNISIETLEPVLDKCDAVMVVHYGGRPVDIHPLLSTGKIIIEDVAHAVDSSIDNKRCGTFGHVSAFSFDPIKNIATPDSGGVLVSESEVVKAKALRNLGISSSGHESEKDNWWENDTLNRYVAKYLPNDISAIFAIEQLKDLELNQRKRKELWDLYQILLSELDFVIKEADVPVGFQHSYFTYLLRVKQGRDDLAKYLRQNNVYTTLRFNPLHFNSSFSHADLKNTEVLGKEGLNLPLHPNLTPLDVERVVHLIKKWGEFNSLRCRKSSPLNQKMGGKMKAAVIGGSGFIGSEIVSILRAQGHDVIVADRIGNNTYCDITKMETLQFLDGVDEVYNLAGVLGTAELETQIYEAVKVNVLGATNVFEACNKYGVKRLFYPSKPNVWRNVYTITKEASEELAKKYNENFPTRICSLRLFNVFGPRQKLTPVRKMIPIFAAQAILGLPIQIWGDGQQTVDLIYSKDIAKIIVDFSSLGTTEFLDLGRGIALTVLEVANLVNDYYGNKSGVSHLPMRPGETPNTLLVADIQRLSSIVDLHFTDFKKSMDETLEYYSTVQRERLEEGLRFYGI
jgi:dTDP-4-amino-4,6-dideoxygalactose transaminase/nucleoside-diphosphate-sugar epimerase